MNKDYYTLVVRGKHQVQKLPLAQVKQNVDSVTNIVNGIICRASADTETISEDLSPLLRGLFSSFTEIVVSPGIALSRQSLSDFPWNNSFLTIGTEADAVLVCIRKFEEPIYVVEDIEDLSEPDMPTVYHWLFYRYLLHSRQLETVL